MATTSNPDALPLHLLPQESAPDPFAAVLAAQAAITITREAAIDAALTRHTETCRASRDLPAVERRAARRASSAICSAAIDRAHAAAAAARIASRTVADLQRDGLALLAGLGAELEERAASAPSASRSADALLADLATTVSAALEPCA